MAQRGASSSFSQPPVIIGCWQLTERDKNPRSAVKTLKSYHDAGFTAFDTADIYGPSEQLLGRFVEEELGGNSSALQVFTKYVVQDGSEGNARAINERSRGYLYGSGSSGGSTKEEKILSPPLDLVQFHWWDFSDKGYLKAAVHLKTLQREGKIKHLAVTNFDTKHLKEVLTTTDYPIEVNQVQYSLLDRRPENAMLGLAREFGFKLNCFGTVAGGWLSDRWLGKDAAEAQRVLESRESTVSQRMYADNMMRWMDGGGWGQFQKLLRTMREIGEKKGVSIANVASLWVLQQLDRLGHGGAVIIGVRDTRHLEETKVLLGYPDKVHLSDEDMTKLTAVADEGKWPKGEDIWSRERR